MIIIFDMDGVILDSESTLVEIYRSLGVNPPENLFASEGVPWLATQTGEHEEVIRRLKDVAFATAIAAHRIRLLSGYYAAVNLAERGENVGLVTSAAYSAVDALWRISDPWPFTFVAAKTRPSRRMNLFRQFRECPVYVDDQTFDLFNPRVVHYQRQSVERLIEEIKWTSVSVR